MATIYCPAKHNIKTFPMYWPFSWRCGYVVVVIRLDDLVVVGGGGEVGGTIAKQIVVSIMYSIDVQFYNPHTYNTNNIIKCVC